MAGPEYFNQHIFFATVELASLSSALQLASKCVSRELAAIDEGLAAGTVPEDYDFETAADGPLALSQLISRAIAYELVAIVEHRLHKLAEQPWLKSSKRKKNEETGRNSWHAHKA